MHHSAMLLAANTCWFRAAQRGAIEANAAAVCLQVGDHRRRLVPPEVSTRLVAADTRPSLLGYPYASMLVLR